MLPGGVQVERTQPAVGAVLSGLDLARGISAEQAESLKNALFAHGAVFLRGQEAIGYPEHLALARIFGTPVCDGNEPDRPEVVPIRARAGTQEDIARWWHSDDCYAATPPSVSVLRAIEPCTFGGDTCFSSAVAAYLGLPDELKQQIAGLRYHSSFAKHEPADFTFFGTRENWVRLCDRYPPVTQPVVIVHPVTGARALYTNFPWTHAIVGMDPAEGQALIHRLASEFTRTEYQTRWSWRKGDIAIWDNRLVQHCGVPDHQTDRYLERITIDGDVQLSIADWEARQGQGQALQEENCA